MYKNFCDLGLRDRSEDLLDKAGEIGWEAAEIETAFLEAEDWGELKRKIDEEREKNDVLIFLGGDEDLNRKAAGDSRIDILMHPEKDRKDSGFNHVMAEEAAENNVAVGFDLRQVLGSKKQQSHKLRHWTRNLELCEKYDVPYIITSGAGEIHELRAPRELAALIDSLGFDGKEAVEKYPSMIIERNRKVNQEGYVRPGVEKGDQE